MEQGPLFGFATDLRALRVAAGTPSYRQLSRKAGYTPSALSAAAAGDMLPSLAVCLAYVGACGGDVAEWERRWQETAGRLRRTEQDLLAEPPAAAVEDFGPADGDGLRPATGDDAPPAMGLASAAGEDGAVLATSAASHRPSVARFLLVPLIAAVVVVAVVAAVLIARHYRGDGTSAAGTAGHVTTTGRGATTADQSSIGGAVRTRYDFEDGPAPWGIFWNPASLTTATTTPGYGGGAALRLDVRPNSGRSPAFGTTHIGGLLPGSVVTFHVRYVRGVGALHPFVQETSFAPKWSSSPGQVFPGADGWVTYTWRTPDVPLKAIGFQLDNSGAADLVIDLDAVAW